MYTEFLLASDKTITPGVIVVSDLSNYDPDVREDYGVILMWSTDYFDSDITIDISNPGSTDYPGTWQIPVANNAVYSIEGFIAPKWEDISYNPGDIVYHNFSFWVKVTPAGPGCEPGEDPDWLLLDANMLTYTYFRAAENVGRYVMSQTIECRAFHIYRKGCHQYSFIYSGTGAGVAYFQLYDYEGNRLICTQMLLNEDSEFCFTTEQDGVYVAKITPTDAIYLEYDDVLYASPIYDFCDTKACVDALIKSTISRCDEACSEPCGREERIAQENYRNELNKILAIYYPLLGYIQTDMTINSLVLTIDQDRQSLIPTVGAMIDRLRVIIGKCGRCTDETSTSNSNPCQNC